MMPGWLTILVAICSAITAVAGTGALLWKPVHKIVDAAGGTYRALYGEKGRPGLLAEFQEVKKQTLPNGGSSMRDAIGRTERSANRAETQAAAAAATAKASAGRVQTLAERLDRHIEQHK